jgi:hypothetical protein
MSRARTAALLALLVLVAGCSGAGIGGGQDLGASTDGAEMRASSDGGGDGSARSVETDGQSGESNPIAQVRNRQLIYTATVELEVEDYDRARSDLTAAARQRGGFVSNANERRHTAAGGNFTTGTVTYRVPADEFDAFLATVNETGTVVAAQQNTEDVTEQVVDLNARLRTLRAQRDRLRELYQQANDTEEVLAVEERLSEVQTQIERAEARKMSLERQVALSTVTVEIREPRPGAPPEGAWYDTPLVEAFLASVNGVVVTVRALAVAGAYAAPYLLAFGLPPVAGAAFAWRRWGGRGSSDDLGLDDADGPPDDGTGPDAEASDDAGASTDNASDADASDDPDETDG